MASVDQALEILNDEGDGCQVLAGGTDVMLQLLRGEITPRLLVHVERLAELRGVADANGNGVRLGALVTHRQLVEGALRGRYRGLVEAAATVGGWQTQAVGTLVGNICNASPAADTLPPMLAHDASVVLQGAKGSRTVALQDFLVGRRQTDREPDELVTEIVLAPPPERSGDVYLKVGRRKAMEVAIVGLAARLTFAPDGVVTDARVALASVAPTPVRAQAAEALLTGAPLSTESIAEAGNALSQVMTPIDDVRGTADYRRQVAPRLLQRALHTCAERAGVASAGEE